MSSPATATSPRGRPQGGGRTPSENRDRFLDAAEDCFTEQGVETTTMADVVTRAGTSRALLYRHFSNRDELIAGVLTRTTDRYLDHIRAALGDGGPFGPTLVEGMALIVEMARADQLMGLVFRGEGEAIASGVVSSSDALRDRSAAFAAEVFAGMDEDDLAQINPDLELSEVIDHCMLVGLGLIRGFDHIATDPKLLRRHLETFLLPGILR